MKINNTTDTALYITVLNMIKEGTEEEPGEAEMHIKLIKPGSDITLDSVKFNDIREITIRQ